MNFSPCNCKLRTFIASYNAGKHVLVTASSSSEKLLHLYSYAEYVATHQPILAYFDLGPMTCVLAPYTYRPSAKVQKRPGFDFPSRPK